MRAFHRWHLRGLFFLLALWGTLNVAWSQNAALTSSAASVPATLLAQKLASHDHVLLIRHASAPGVGDPPNYTLNDCRTQRNLGPEGRKQATHIGEWLRQQGVRAADVYSSPWCRCKDTAELMQLGGYRIEASLASFFDQMHLVDARNKALQAFVAQQLKTKGPQALILVTHHVNIQAFMGENIGSGDMVLVQVDGRGKPIAYQRIPSPT